MWIDSNVSGKRLMVEAGLLLQNFNFNFIPVHRCFVPPLMKTTAWLSKHLAINNQFLASEVW